MNIAPKEKAREHIDEYVKLNFPESKAVPMALMSVTLILRGMNRGLLESKDRFFWQEVGEEIKNIMLSHMRINEEQMLRTLNEIKAITEKSGHEN